MKTNEHDYYSELANWSFEDIDYITETLTNWVYEEKIKELATKDSKVIDLGTEEMIASANKNLLKSGRKNISFKVMDNLNMNTPDDYFDLVTARHTITVPKQIYKTLKKGGYILIRGVDKLDCWALKRMFGRGQAFHDKKPISQIDYEAILDAGFKDVELIPLHVIEYYKTKEDLLALLVKTPILDDLSEETSDGYERVPIEQDILDDYVAQNTTDKGIKLVRRYYGIVGRK